jgi:ATP synthase protein I
VASGFGWTRGWDAALAASYGGMVTMLLTLWLAWRVRRAGSRGAGMVTIYSGVAARYALAAMGIAVGIGWIKLLPIPMLSSFAVTQFGFVVLWRQK